MMMMTIIIIIVYTSQSYFNNIIITNTSIIINATNILFFTQNVGAMPSEKCWGKAISPNCMPAVLLVAVLDLRDRGLYKGAGGHNCSPAKIRLGPNQNVVPR